MKLRAHVSKVLFVARLKRMCGAPLRSVFLAIISCIPLSEGPSALPGDIRIAPKVPPNFHTSCGLTDVLSIEPARPFVTLIIDSRAA